MARIEEFVPASEAERVGVLEAIEDLSLLLADLRDEGYVALAEAFESAHNSSERLLAARLRHGRENDPINWAPLPRADHAVPPTARAGGLAGYGARQPLEGYLCSLLTVTWSDVPEEIAEGLAWAPWRAAATQILADQLAFARFALARRPDGLVCLLRDTLPQWLVATWMGVPTAAIGVGRALLEQFGSGLEVYDLVARALYFGIQAGGSEFDRVWALALEALRAELPRHSSTAAVAEALRRAVAPLLPCGRLLVVEAGYQATMPLLLGAIFPQARDWLMYASAPWLVEVYRGRVFRERYAVSRPAETLACTESLFKLEFHGDAWYACESRDPLVRGRACWEIAQLRDWVMAEAYREAGASVGPNILHRLQTVG